MFPLSVEAKLIAGATAALALAAAVWGVLAHERHLGAQQLRAAVQHEADAASAANAAEGARRAAVQQENLRDQAQFDARRLADARDLDAAVQRLRQQAAARRRTAPRDPGTAVVGAPPGAAGDLPADMCGRAVEAVAAAASIAEYADSLRSSGQLCAADYDALRKQP